MVRDEQPVVIERSTDNEFVDALVQSAFGVIGVVGETAAKHGLSLTLFRVCAILRDRALTMSELADYLGLDRSTITGLVDRAAERGLLRRLENERDKRSSRATLTEMGHTTARICAEEVASNLAPLVVRLGPTERERLTGLLGKLVTIPPQMS